MFVKWKTTIKESAMIWIPIYFFQIIVALCIGKLSSQTTSQPNSGKLLQFSMELPHMKFFSINLFWCNLVLCHNLELDQDHLAKYPYCGSMYSDSNGKRSGRVVNAEPAIEHYRWVVFIRRDRKPKIPVQCTGSIITDR